MIDLKEKISQKLKENGYKLTPIRLEIIEVLDQNQTALSVEGIYGKLKKKSDLVTVYRNLHLLEELSIITKLSFGNHHTYELQANHNHYLVCQKCHETERLPSCSLKGIEDSSLKESKKFSQITNHVLQLSGLCKKCTN